MQRGAIWDYISKEVLCRLTEAQLALWSESDLVFTGTTFEYYNLPDFFSDAICTVPTIENKLELGKPHLSQFSQVMQMFACKKRMCPQIWYYSAHVHLPRYRHVELVDVESHVTNPLVPDCADVHCPVPHAYGTIGVPVQVGSELLYAVTQVAPTPLWENMAHAIKKTMKRMSTASLCGLPGRRRHG